ncbi:unnamed protein product [Chironomus riparius]|uniref:Uncharacterized protein n=1 Tax=Chironomus riparius TaxID=315576 RepID=A0A9N9RJB2_9DIPT|nr:unnamed protein product [Chironomus riparius]
MSQCCDFEKQFFYLTLRSKKTKDDDSFSNLLFRTTIDVCKVIKGAMSNFIVKIIMEGVRKSTDFALECPFKKNTYKFVNFKADLSMMPPIFHGEHGLLIIGKLMVKVTGNKQIGHALTLNIYFKNI